MIPRLFLNQLTPLNLLSFGPETAPINLNALNVLIGPNGSGKSNFIEAIALLRASARDVRAGLEGGVSDWVWKGDPLGVASLEAVLENPYGEQNLRHRLAFRAEQQTFRLKDEQIENVEPYPGQRQAYFYYHYQNGQPVLNIKNGQRRLTRENVELNQSILPQRRDPDTYPEISYLASMYERIRLYREWAFGRHTIFRMPQKTDVRNDRLEEDFSNLGMFLNRLAGDPRIKTGLLAALGDLYAGLDDLHFSIQGGSVQVFFTEDNFSIPATRLSDGTLRYLCLLAILCDPEPPPLVGIEEPELGLHPDILPKLADLLVEASSRTQLIVTTHSDMLVDALTDHPEAILVCEKHDGATEMKRLNAEHLAHWLQDYRLGELWMRGELGGTRW